MCLRGRAFVFCRDCVAQGRGFTPAPLPRFRCGGELLRAWMPQSVGRANQARWGGRTARRSGGARPADLPPRVRTGHPKKPLYRFDRGAGRTDGLSFAPTLRAFGTVRRFELDTPARFPLVFGSASRPEPILEASANRDCRRRRSAACRRRELAPRTAPPPGRLFRRGRCSALRFRRFTTRASPGRAPRRAWRC